MHADGEGIGGVDAASQALPPRPANSCSLIMNSLLTAGFSGGQAEDLRRALGFKRSERRMKEVEIKLRAGMAKNGITGDVAEQIVSSITARSLSKRLRLSRRSCSR